MKKTLLEFPRPGIRCATIAPLVLKTLQTLVTNVLLVDIAQYTVPSFYLTDAGEQDGMGSCTRVRLAVVYRLLRYEKAFFLFYSFIFRGLVEAE